MSRGINVDYFELCDLSYGFEWIDICDVTNPNEHCYRQILRIIYIHYHVITT